MSTDNVTSLGAGNTPHLETNRPFLQANDHKAMDVALIDLRQKLFLAMGIVRLASVAIRDPQRAGTEAGLALDAAHALLTGVADGLQSSYTMLVGGNHGEY